MVNIGDKFDMLVVIEQHAGNKWTARCDCGTLVGPYHASKMIMSHSCRACYHSKRLPARTRKTGIHNASTSTYRNYQSSARRRGLIFDIDYDFFMELIQDKCSYCGGTGRSYFNATNDWEEKFEYTGLDRINSSIGYTKENVVPCCKVCNMAKSNLTPQDFYDWIIALHSNLYNIVALMHWHDDDFKDSANESKTPRK